MDKHNVTKETLISIMKANRAKHVDIYEQAVVKYREQAIVELTKQLVRAKEGKKFSLNFPQLTKPVSFVKEYDNTIGLLEMSLASVVEITTDEYKRFIKDEWNWKNMFNTSNSKYLSEAVGESLEDNGD